MIPEIIDGTVDSVTFLRPSIAGVALRFGHEQDAFDITEYHSFQTHTLAGATVTRGIRSMGQGPHWHGRELVPAQTLTAHTT